MGVFPHEERPIGALAAAVVADRLRDGEDVRLGKAAAQRRSPMAARTEADQLRWIAHVRPALVILPLQLRDVDEQFLWSRASGQRRDLRLRLGPGAYGIGHGFTSQMSWAYSAIERSLENFP